jgi:uroporphyrinogen decarboxylase
MNGYRRTMAALKGEWPDVRPVMLHNFMMAAHEAGVSMRQYRSDPEALARCHIQAVERYGYDAIVVDVDTATLAGAAGVPVAMPDDEPAVCHGSLLKSLGEVDGLAPVNIAEYPRVQIWLEAVRILRRHFGDEVLVRGNCDQCPYALASLVRGSEAWMLELMDEANEQAAERLLEWCSGITLQFLALMKEAGAHMLSNGDSSAGPSLVSPRIYRQFAWRHERRVVSESHRLGLPYLLHICGKTEKILAEMVETGADALELDYKTDPAVARREMDTACTFVGNIDPTGVLAHGTVAAVEAQTRELIHVFADSPRLIVNAGCGIPALTPPENLRAMIRVARQGLK